MSTEARVIAVAVIEDRSEIREGLAALVGESPGYRCAGAFESMEAAIARLAHDVPHVALIDIGLPGMSGIEGISILRERWPQILLIVLSVYEDDRRIFDALCAGACGYLIKKTPPERLLEALQEAMDGGSPMSPTIARRVVSLFKQIRPPETASHGLTPHELRILGMVSAGHHYKTAAVELGVTPRTVAFHLQQIYRKLEVHSKSEAVAKALRHGLIT